MTSLKARLFSAAQADAGLAALLYDGQTFHWYDQRLPQPAQFPAVVAAIASNPATYAVTGKLPTSTTRVQFTVYGTGNDSENANAVVTALQNFLAGFWQGVGIQNLPAYSNIIVADRDFGVAETQPLTYLRIVDAQIFWNDSI
jgi:hypothetical protein